MMDLFGTYQISFDAIRRRAIECHALNAGAYELLCLTTIDNLDAVRRQYEEIFSEKLLEMAISLRAKFYQGVPHNDTARFIQHSGFLWVNDKQENHPFSIKDVCDKIIHADTVVRSLEDGCPNTRTQIRGIHNGTPWILDISTSLFCEGVLNWIASIDQECRQDC